LPSNSPLPAPDIYGLLSVGFESELLSILNRMTHPRRQTLLFSATLTTSLEQLEDIASLNGTLRFDLT
jgi:superfamily II DNA/RNA helicase